MLQPAVRAGFEVQEQLTCVSFGYKILVLFPLPGYGSIIAKEVQDNYLGLS